MLLPPAFQDKTQFLPLGKKVEKPEPLKADPVAEFEKKDHDIQAPCFPAFEEFVKRQEGRLPRHVTPELAARALDTLIALSDAEMAKARARLIESGSIEDLGLKDGDVVTMACFPGKSYTIADLTASSVSSVVAEFKASQLDIKQRGYPLRGEWLRRSVANAERKLDWPKLDEV